MDMDDDDAFLYGDEPVAEEPSKPVVALVKVEQSRSYRFVNTVHVTYLT